MNSTGLISAQWPRSRGKAPARPRALAVLQNDPEVLADKVTVTVDTFNAYSIDLRCRVYITKTSLADFLQAKNRLNLQIMDVVHKDGCDFAFPTTTIEMAGEM
mgnify:CR=1 FL=1